MNESYYRSLIAAGESPQRFHHVTLTPEHATDEQWQRFADTLAWDNDATAEVDFDVPPIGQWEHGLRDGFDGAFEVWSPAKAAEELFARLEGAAAFDAEAEALREGRWPDSAPASVVSLLPEGPAPELAEVLLRGRCEAPVVREEDFIAEFVDHEAVAGWLWNPLLAEFTADAVLHDLTPDTLEGVARTYERYGGTVDYSLTSTDEGPDLPVVLHVSSEGLVQAANAIRRHAHQSLPADPDTWIEQRDPETPWTAVDEAIVWIGENGSERLKRILEAGLLFAAWDVYEDERLAVERPGWRWSEVEIEGETVDLAECTVPPGRVSLPAIELCEAVAAEETGDDAELMAVRLPFSWQTITGYAVFDEHRGKVICRFDDLLEDLATDECVLAAHPDFALMEMDDGVPPAVAERMVDRELALV